MSRPDWDETWLAVADTIALRSRCVRAQVGAVIVTRDNRVASVSYNGPPSGLDVTGDCINWCPRAQGLTSLGADYGGCATIHAEANGLLRADWSQIQGGTVYVNRSMCINCAKQIGGSGLKRVVHRVTDDDLHRHPDDVESYLKTLGLEVTRVSP